MSRSADSEARALVGSFGDPGDATAALQLAQEVAHVVSPTLTVATIPEGFDVVLALVNLDIRDTYAPEDAVGDLVCLDRRALAVLGVAAGVNWEHSRRTDDQKHPHYVSWEVAISYDQFDGKPCQVIGNVDVDTREPEGAAYIATVEAADGGDYTPALIRARRFLVRTCESMAMNRAIAAMGVRQKYTREELQKPFLVARLSFTGRSSDPELRRQFQAMIAERYLGAKRALYGQSAERAA